MKKGHVIEGSWICSYCGSTNPGLKRECSGCGRPKGIDTGFELNDSHRKILSESEANEALKGADWYCDFCDTYNKAGDDACAGCGVPKDASKRNYFDIKRQQEDKAKAQTDSGNNPYRQEEVSSRKEDPVDNKKHVHKVLLIVAMIALAVGLSIFGLIKLAQPKPDTLTVTGMEWVYTINIEEQVTVEENGWSLPAGARLLYTREEQRSEERVIDHYEMVTKTETRRVLDHIEKDVVVDYEDLGNGTFQEILEDVEVWVDEEYEVEVEEPVYIWVPVMDTKYYYEIDKWVYKRNVTTHGNDKSPYWGEDALGENERRSGSAEQYSITAYNSKGEEKTYNVSYIYWHMIEVGDTLDVLVDIDGEIYILDENGDVIEYDNSAGYEADDEPRRIAASEYLETAA